MFAAKKHGEIQWKLLVAYLAVPLATGGLSGLLTREGMKVVSGLRQPPLAPPDWLFPVVWTILYLMMGAASYRVYVSGSPRPPVQTALTVYGVQLAMNFCWTLLFFNARLFLFAFIWLALLWLMIGLTALLFFRIQRGSGWLLIPYLLWVAFAGYLNFGVYLLN